MKLKSWQLSLGSLFLAILTFAIGLVIGLRFNVNREQDRREIGKLEKQIDGLKVQMLKLAERDQDRQLAETFRREDDSRRRKLEESLRQRIEDLNK